MGEGHYNILVYHDMDLDMPCVAHIMSLTRIIPYTKSLAVSFTDFIQMG